MNVPWVGSTTAIDRRIRSSCRSSRPYGNCTRYLVRAEPGRRDELMKTVESKLIESNHNRIVRSLQSMETIRAEAMPTIAR